MEHEEYLVFAAQMLEIANPDNVPNDLFDRLLQIDCLITRCPKYQGEPARLRSRQVVAMVVEQWQREQKDKD